MEFLVNLIALMIFLILQSFFINGVYYSFSKGNVFNRINPEFFEKHKKKIWALPLWSCIRCMSSVWGTATFWIPVIYFFGFCPIEMYVFIIDIGCLVTLNWIVFKKVN